MSETCLRWEEHGARVMIEKKKIPHYNINVDPEKKEVTCWIESQAGKVRKFLFTMTSVTLPHSNKSRRFP